MDKLIELREVTAGYGNKIALRNVTLDVWKNDFLGIIGPNGGGKTTLLKVILGLLPPISGTIRFYDENVEVPSLKIGYLPQMSQIDKKFPISVREVISSGLSAEKPLFRPFSRSQRERVDEVIVQMGLEELAGRAIGELSGGQLQRVLLGRSIVSRPQVLILDEPNSYVDKRFESRFYQLLEEINKESAIILVSHDIGTVLTMVKNIACVNETLHYHPGANVSEEWLGEKYACPIELVGHGDLPHRVLKKHQPEYFFFTNNSIFMIPQIICWISLPEIGYIVGIAVILFGCKAVSQNPFISKKQKILWMLTILFLNWIGLLWYYYTFYMKEK